MPLIASPEYPGVFFADLMDAEGGVFSDAVDGDLSLSWIVWRGLVIAPLADSSTPFHLQGLKGWESTPQVSYDDVAIAGGRGVAVTPGSMGPRIVTVTGWCHDRPLRNKLLAILRGSSAPSVGSLVTEQLAVTHGGRTLYADAQLVKADADPEGVWGVGRFGFTLQWRCADPMRYGTASTSVVAVKVPTLGITFPVTGSWVLPADPVGGVVRVANPGMADSDATFSLAGPISGPGVAVIETGAWARFDFDIGAGDTLVIDTAQGVCTLNGEYRSPGIASSLLEELRLPANATSTVQALGTPLPGSPSMSVQSRPAYW